MHKFAGVTFDHYDDGGATLRSFYPNAEDVPDFVKSAELKPRERQLDQDFALIAVDEGRVFKKYACDNAASTLMSVLYFGENGHKLPEMAQKVAADNLLLSSIKNGLLDPSELTKEANIVDVAKSIYNSPLVRDTARMGALGGAAGAIGGASVAPTEDTSRLRAAVSSAIPLAIAGSIGGAAAHHVSPIMKGVMPYQAAMTGIGGLSSGIANAKTLQQYDKMDRELGEAYEEYKKSKTASPFNQGLGMAIPVALGGLSAAGTADSDDRVETGLAGGAAGLTAATAGGLMNASIPWDDIASYAKKAPKQLEAPDVGRIRKVVNSLKRLSPEIVKGLANMDPKKRMLLMMGGSALGAGALTGLSNRINPSRGTRDLLEVIHRKDLKDVRSGKIGPGFLTFKEINPEKTASYEIVVLPEGVKVAQCFHNLIKKASFKPSELALKTLEDPRVKTASYNVVDVSGKKASPVVKEASGNHWAFVDGQTKKYPINDEGQVKQASDYWLANQMHMDPGVRRQFAVKVAARAEELDVAVDEKVKQAGAKTYGSEDQLEKAIVMRKVAFPHESPAQQELTKVASYAGQVSPEAYAAALGQFDQEHGLDQLWDRAIPDPFQSTYGIQKVAKIIWEDGADRISEEALHLLATQYIGDVDELFSDNIVTGFDKDPIATFNKLPTPLKRRMARLAEDKRFDGGTEAQSTWNDR